MDDDRGEIQEELSKMTFEDLQKLKEKLGSKVYNEAIFGTKKTEVKPIKRENKNRPRELSSRKPVHTKKYSQTSQLPRTKLASQPRDPRFDPICGSFDEERFQTDYNFINNVKEREKKALIRQLKQEEDPMERTKLKRLLRSMKNKEKTEKIKKEKASKQKAEKEETIESLSKGKKPHFRTKLEKKVASLVDQYSNLKSSGKLQKHIEKLRKRRMQNERKAGIFDSAFSDDNT